MSRKKALQTPKGVLLLPDLDVAKSAVLNMASRLQQTVVLRYRLELGCRQLSSSTINLRLAAVRRLAYEAADTGLLSPESAAGVRLGTWLSAEQVKTLLRSPDLATVRGKGDRVIIAVLAGCGLRRSEVAHLSIPDSQKRDDRWVIVDLYGKGGHIRTVPVPDWVKRANYPQLPRNSSKNRVHGSHPLGWLHPHRRRQPESQAIGVQALRPT